jgi:hypothetical protein
MRRRDKGILTALILVFSFTFCVGSSLVSLGLIKYVAFFSLYPYAREVEQISEETQSGDLNIIFEGYEIGGSCDSSSKLQLIETELSDKEIKLFYISRLPQYNDTNFLLPNEFIWRDKKNLFVEYSNAVSISYSPTTEMGKSLPKYQEEEYRRVFNSISHENLILVSIVSTECNGYTKDDL